MPIALTVSRRGQVLDNVVETLRGMRLTGGYHWTVRSESVDTDPRNVMGIAAEECPFFIVEGSPEGRRDFEPASQLRDAFRVMITAVLFAEGTAPHRKAAAGETMAGDLERLLTRDLSRGGYATDTRVLSPEIMVALGGGGGEANRVVVVQEIECAIHRTHGEP